MKKKENKILAIFIIILLFGNIVTFSLLSIKINKVEKELDYLFEHYKDVAITTDALKQVIGKFPVFYFNNDSVKLVNDQNIYTLTGNRTKINQIRFIQPNITGRIFIASKPIIEPKSIIFHADRVVFKEKQLNVTFSNYSGYFNFYDVDRIIWKINGENFTYWRGR